MPQPRQLTSKEYDHILELHANGKSRNDIARIVGRSGSAVSKVVKTAGLTFARGEQVLAATQAKQVDNQARRAELQTGLLDDAIRLRQDLFAPYTLHSFGGRDNTYNSKRLKQPPAKDQRDIVGAISQAITSAVKLAEVDKNQAQGAVVDQWLAFMAGEPDQ